MPDCPTNRAAGTRPKSICTQFSWRRPGLFSSCTTYYYFSSVSLLWLLLYCLNWYDEWIVTAATSFSLTCRSQDELPGASFYGLEKDFGSIPLFAIGGTCIATSVLAGVGIQCSHSRHIVNAALSIYLVSTLRARLLARTLLFVATLQSSWVL